MYNYMYILGNSWLSFQKTNKERCLYHKTKIISMNNITMTKFHDTNISGEEKSVFWERRPDQVLPSPEHWRQ